MTQLEGSKSYIDQLQEMSGVTLAEDLKAREEVVGELRNQIFSGEGEIYKLLNKHLANIDENGRTASELLKEYSETDNEEERIKIAKELKIAEKQSELDQYIDSQSEILYKQEQDIQEQYKKVSEYDPTGANVGSALGMGIGLGGAAAAGTATAGMIIGSAVPVFGTIIGGLVGALVGGVAGWLASDASQQQALEEEERRWSLLGYDERLQEIEDRRENKIEDLEKAIKDGNTEEVNKLQQQIEALDEMSDSLKSMIELQNKMRDEVNDQEVEIAFESAIVTSGKYLSELNYAQLKQLGVKGIYDTLYEQLGEDTLIGLQIQENGEYTKAFINKANKILKQDEEISAILSGKGYTLSEFAGSYNANDQFDREKLKLFAEALKIPVSSLNNSHNLSRYGMLDLSEMYMSTDELGDKISSLSSLTSSITSSGGNISE